MKTDKDNSFKWKGEVKKNRKCTRHKNAQGFLTEQWVKYVDNFCSCRGGPCFHVIWHDNLHIERFFNRMSNFCHFKNVRQLRHSRYFGYFRHFQYAQLCTNFVLVYSWPIEMDKAKLNKNLNYFCFCSFSIVIFEKSSPQLY